MALIDAGGQVSVPYDPFRVFHYGFVVPDMDRAMTQWRRQGAVVLVEPAVDPIQNVKCCLLMSMGCVPIELVAPMPSGPTPISSRLAKGGGLDHVCLFSDDLEAEIERMRRDGAVLTVEPCYASVFRRRLAFLVTRPGLVVELMTRHTVDGGSDDPLANYLALSRRA